MLRFACAFLYACSKLLLRLAKLNSNLEINVRLDNMFSLVPVNSSTLEEQPMSMKTHSFLKYACRRGIVKTAFKVALIVGTILAAINHGDSIMGSTMDSRDWLKVALTYFVPYMVSTYSAVKVLQRAADSL
jgi:hypothetical protein